MENVKCKMSGGRDARRKNASAHIMPGYNEPPYSEIFQSQDADWGEDEGRGFYERSDNCGETIESLLMNGFYALKGIDIPDGRVKGYPPKPRHSFDTVFREVGISNVEVNQL